MNRLRNLMASMLMLVVFITVPVAALAEINDPDLVGLWHMDGNWRDASVAGNNGIANNGVSFSTSAKLGTAAGSFDGADDFVSIANSDLLNQSTTAAISIELWAKSSIDWNLHKNWTALINKQYESQSGFAIHVRNNYPTVFFEIKTDVGSFSAISNDLIKNQWYHFVGTYDGNAIKFYQNGMLVRSTSASGNIKTNNLNLEIGRWRSNYNEYFNGLIDEVRIYKRALSENEVQAHYLTSVVNYPTVNPVTSPTTSATITLSGTKPANTAIIVNGNTLVPLDGTTSWQTSYTLAQGTNTVAITAQDGNGLNSLPVVSVVVLDTKPPQVTTTTPTNDAILKTAPGAVTFTLVDALTPLNLPAILSSANMTTAAGTAIAGTWNVSGSGTGGTVTFIPISTLAEGTYSCTIKPTDALANAASYTLTFTVDTTPPVLTVSTLRDGAYTNNETLNIAGTVTDDTEGTEITINGDTVSVNTDGSFSHALLLKSGGNTISTTATDSAGNTTTDTRTITLDQTAPVLTVTAPADNSKTGNLFLDVNGTVDKTSTVTVKRQDIVQCASMDGGAFTTTLTLNPGYNTIEITAADLAGNLSAQKRTVLYDDQKPSLAIIEPNQDIRTSRNSLTIKGTVADELTAVGVTIRMNGEQFTPLVVNGRFEQTVNFTEEKTYDIVVTATNEVGATTSVQRNVIYDITPPELTIDPIPSPTSRSSLSITGTREAGTTVAVSCTKATVGMVSYPTETTWQADISGLKEGENVIIAAAADAAGNTVSATATVILSSKLPEITVAADPEIIWPPNHKMVPVTITGGVDAVGSAVESVSISVNDEYGTFNYNNLVFGSVVLLEAWRKGNDKDGRIYTITVVVTSKGGTTTTKTATVTVPHDESKSKKDDGKKKTKKIR